MPLETQRSAPKTSILNPRFFCGIQNGNNVVLKSTSNYYSQVLLQMFVSGLTMCTFVVWTNKGIFTVEVLCDSGFVSVVCTKLEEFWISQVLPVVISVAPCDILAKQLPQIPVYPIVSSFFYTTLCGEQDVGPPPQEWFTKHQQRSFLRQTC